ncbi:YraN family protein [Corynebacterium mayonis]|uniref:YraN family protein n=1 Tax=Corynebacterium mayonis TaxID=3062461 RepID=UPI0031409960
MTQSTYEDNHLLGIAGEGFALGVYESAGYTLIDSRVRTRCGEIDLILKDEDGTIVFVEVKSRRGRSFGGAEAVTAKKLATMRRCAGQWLEEQPYSTYSKVRFDVAEVIFTSEDVQITLYEDVDHGAC